jgi:hypothetical protein
MWTGENRLKSIATYIQGYWDGLTEQNTIDAIQPAEPFHDWVANRLGFFESTAGWANMILAFSLGLDPKNVDWEELQENDVTEEEHIYSIKQFYLLLDEYKQMNQDDRSHST